MSSALGVLTGVALLAVGLAFPALLRSGLRALHEHLLQRAIERLPPDLRARYAEEWRADLAALAGRPGAATAWAVGLRRAASDLCLQAAGERVPRRGEVVPQVALDAVSLALAYYAAYRLRFPGDVPATYDALFERTLPFAVVGGVVCLGMVGNYAAAVIAPVKVVRGVGLATLAIAAYTTLMQPMLVAGRHGFVALNVPAGVCALFAVSACALLVLSRSGMAVTRAART